MPTFETFDFEVLQLRYLKAAMDQIPTFLPDGKTAADAQAMRDSAEAVKTAYQTADTTLGFARGELKEKHDAAHLLCVQVYPIMKSRYRTDPGSLNAINRLPTKDQTVRQTRDRMSAMSLLWGQLPDPPGSVSPFEAWGGMDKAAFDAVLAVLVTDDEALPATVQAYEKAQGDFHVELDLVEDFVTAALIQGRAQFPDGTPEREIIDAIPMEPAQQPPAQAVISLAQSPGPGEVLLEYDANHATMFDIFQKGPSDPDFIEIVTDAITRSYSASGLADGDYEFKVSGQNSLGNGPDSDVSMITVGAGQLDQVTGLQLQEGPTNSIDASWNAVTGAAQYAVQRKEISVDPDFVQVGTPSGTSLVFGGFSSGATVQVRVKAVGSPGPGGTPEGPYSTIAEITFP